MRVFLLASIITCSPAHGDADFNYRQESEKERKIEQYPDSTSMLLLNSFWHELWCCRFFSVLPCVILHYHHYQCGHLTLDYCRPSGDSQCGGRGHSTPLTEVDARLLCHTGQYPSWERATRPQKAEGRRVGLFIPTLSIWPCMALYGKSAWPTRHRRVAKG